MSFEELVPLRGAHTRSAGVTASWRRTRQDGPRLLGLTLGAEVCSRMRLTRGKRVRAERDAILNRIRLFTDNDAGWKPAWNTHKTLTNSCTVYLPLPDILLHENKPAQGVKFEYIEGGIEVRLPPWSAMPGVVKVPMKVVG